MFQKAVMGQRVPSCTELQKGINPPSFSCAPIWEEQQLWHWITQLFFLHFFPERSFWIAWKILGKAEGSEFSGLFQQMFLKVHISIAISLWGVLMTAVVVSKDSTITCICTGIWEFLVLVSCFNTVKVVVWSMCVLTLKMGSCFHHYAFKCWFLIAAFEIYKVGLIAGGSCRVLDGRFHQVILFLPWN